MKDIFRKIVNKKYFHISVIIIIIAIILLILGVITLRYYVEGETNMPFNLSKITIISSSEGIDKDAGENRWAFDINQNNDIFLYIEKNSSYGKDEAIKSVSIQNIQISRTSEKGEPFIYHPDKSIENSIFNSKDENKADIIEYIGSMDSDMKQMKISNQGGIVAFRYANDKVAEYISNEEEINHSNLLKKLEFKEEDLQAKLTFDIVIKVESRKQYQANISLDLPVKDIIENGTTSLEMKDLDNIVFKRI